MRFGVDKTRIAHQTIGDEAIVVDFQMGTYFSLRDSAAEIWELLTGSMPVDDLISLYRSDNPEQAQAVESEIRTFIAELVAANLLSRDESFFNVDPQQTPIKRGPFSKPLLEKFDDMSELIMLDPVHDVTEHGWPHKIG
jgi:hypothetical protein